MRPRLAEVRYLRVVVRLRFAGVKVLRGILTIRVADVGFPKQFFWFCRFVFRLRRDRQPRRGRAAKTPAGLLERARRKDAQALPIRPVGGVSAQEESRRRRRRETVFREGSPQQDARSGAACLACSGAAA